LGIRPILNATIAIAKLLTPAVMKLMAGRNNTLAIMIGIANRSKPRPSETANGSSENDMTIVRNSTKSELATQGGPYLFMVKMIILPTAAAMLLT
jgi:hypothetical protein